MSCVREDKHKRRETKSKACETVCSRIFTTSHFSAKVNLASGNMKIASSHKVTLQKEENKIDFAEGLPKRCTIISEGIRPANDKNRRCPSRDCVWAVFCLRRLLERANVLGAQHCIPAGLSQLPQVSSSPVGGVKASACSY